MGTYFFKPMEYRQWRMLVKRSHRNVSKNKGRVGFLSKHPAKYDSIKKVREEIDRKNMMTFDRRNKIINVYRRYSLLIAFGPPGLFYIFGMVFGRFRKNSEKVKS